MSVREKLEQIEVFKEVKSVSVEREGDPICLLKSLCVVMLSSQSLIVIRQFWFKNIVKAEQMTTCLQRPPINISEQWPQIRGPDSVLKRIHFGSKMFCRFLSVDSICRLSKRRQFNGANVVVGNSSFWRRTKKSTFDNVRFFAKLLKHNGITWIKQLAHENEQH